MICYTIGHSTRKLEDFINTITTYGIDCVMDIRSVPYSSNKFYNSYDKEFVEREIKQSGINYIYMGDVLGHNGKGKDLSREEGKEDFDNIIGCSLFKKGINRIIEGIRRGHRIALMCSEKNPFNCHRSILLGYALEQEGIEVKHIIDEEKFKTQKRIEEELFVTYEPILKNKFLQLSIQDILDKENYDEVNERDIKARIIDEGYRIKFQQI